MDEPSEENVNLAQEAQSLTPRPGGLVASRLYEVPRSGARRRTKGLLLLSGAVVFALAGQYYLAQLRAFMLDGVVLYGVAAVFFLALVRFLEPSAEGHERSWLEACWQALAARPFCTALTGLALLLAVLAGRLASAAPPPPSFTLAIALWLAGGGLVIGAQLRPSRGWLEWPARCRLWIRVHQLELLALAALVLAAGVLRLWQLGEIPYPLSGDEANMGLEARRVLAGELRNPFSTGWLSHPTMWFFWQSWFIKLFGTDLVGLRMLSALVGTSTVVTLYLLAREMFGVTVAQIATAILVAYPFHVHFSRYGINNIGDAWLSPLVFFFLYRGLQRREQLSLVLGGGSLGLMQYGYLGARVVPIIVVAYALYLLVVERGFLKKQLEGLVIFALGALVIAMPIIFWYVRHPDDLTARLAIIGLFQSGWINAEQVRTGRTVLEILWDQVQRSFLAFNFYRDNGPHYRAPGPLLAFLPSIFFVLGIVYAAVSRLDRRFALLLLWLGLTLVFGGVLTLDPPFAPRLVGAIPVVCLLVAVGVWKIVGFLGELCDLPGPAVATVIAAIVGSMMFLDVRFYFTEYAPNPYFTDANTEISTLAGRYLVDLGGGYRAYFFGAPRMYIGHPPLVYIAGRDVGVDVLKPLPPDQRPPMVQGDRRLVFIFVPERLSELETVREFFPGGEVVRFSGRFGKDLFTVYRVD